MTEKMSKILSLMRDYKPRTLREIEEAIGEKCSSSVTNLYQKGLLLATDIKYYMKALTYKGGGRWKRPHGRMRWYLLPKEDEEPPITREVTYEERDSTGRKNIVKTELMQFKPYTEEARVARGNEYQRVVETLKESPTALFSHEIAEKCGISQKRVSSILFRLVNEKEPVVHKAGWRRLKDEERIELMFKNGYLYYSNLEQLKERIAKRDVLRGQKQDLYDRIRRNTEVHRQFTKLADLAKELGIYSKTIAGYLDEVACVYTDLTKEEIAGSTYYYIGNALTQEEIEREREYAKGVKSEESSYRLALGRAHEDFCQVAIDEMIEHGDFKIGEECWWHEVVDRTGVKRRRDIFLNSLDKSKRYEYDAILYVKTPVGKEPNVFVWEMKYRGDLSRDFYDKFIKKLYDTEEFSTIQLVKSEDGHLIKMRTGPSLFKSNVTPVFVIPTVGKKNIRIGERTMNFAEYVTSQGGKIVFTQEYERILEKYYPGKKVNFQRLFKDWWKKEKGRAKFEDFLREYLKF
jgi:hypothetical protein